MFILIPLLAAVSVLLWLFVKILKRPIQWVLKLLLNTLIGFVALFIINWLGAYVGLSLGVNWLNAAVVGVFGIPGVVLLLLIKYILL